MTETPVRDIQREREVFFSRTRKVAVALYVFLALGAISVGAYALADGARSASIGIAIGAAGILALQLVGVLVPISARASRLMIVVLVPLSAAGALVLGGALDSLFDSALVMGIVAGSLGGSALGIALTRRRLARDHELWLRQERLGFDHRRPFDWIRGESDPD